VCGSQSVAPLFSNFMQLLEAIAIFFLAIGQAIIVKNIAK
jgi:hypothetical protein